MLLYFKNELFFHSFWQKLAFCHLFYFISIYDFAIEGTNNAVAGFAIAIRVDGLRHLLISYSIIKESANLRDNEVVIGANEMNGAALQRLGALCGVAHYEHGLAQARGLLLNAARVGEHYSTLLHQIHKLQILQWLNKEEVRTSQVLTEHFVNGLAHIGVEVHGVYEIYLGILLAEVFHGGYHADEAITKVLSAVAGNKYELA